MSALFAAKLRIFARVARPVALLLVAALVSSCAQDLGLIDRVQPGAIHKSVFEGEWYFQRTVVDAPYTVGWTFVGEAEETDRIKWKITQDKLIAYRAYDFIQGTDLAYKKDAKPGENVTGQPVAVYPILKHLDVQRDYAVSTGEQTNVLLENDEDRAWYDRDYIRVDWAKNEGVNFMFPVDTVAMKPVDHVILNPDDPDAFTMGWRAPTAANGTGWSESRDPKRHREAKTADYIDFVTKVHASPEVIDEWDPWWGPMSWPLCWFYFNEDCKAAEIKIRTSLMKVPANETYRPLKYPDNYVLRDDKGQPVRAMEVNGVNLKDGDFDLDNLEGKGIARVTKADLEAAKKAGTPLEPNVVRVPMFDKFGYFRTERYGYDDKYGEVESARPLHIARHDIWERHVDDAGKPIPYAKRTPKPIVYWLGQGFDPQLIEAAKASGKAWDDVFRAIVAAAQGKKAADVPPMFVVKENTLAMDGAGKVTDRGQRVGDIRYSLFSLINEPTRAGLLGYGPTAMDPLSGKILSGHAHVYAGPLKIFASNGRDILRLARGELDPVDYGIGHVASTEVVERLKRFAPTDNSSSPKAKAAKAHAAWQKKVKDAKQFAKKYASRASIKAGKAIKKKLKVEPGWSHKRAQRLRGSKLEDRLITKDMTLMFGSAQDKQKMMASAGGPIAYGKGHKARVSPASWASRAGRRLYRERHKMLAKRNIYHASFAQDAVLGLAESLKDVKDPEKVWQAIYRDVFTSTALHEIGHTLGLRHNFEASSDALNYHDKYWALRGPNGAPMDMGKLSDGQRKAGILDHRYSSIMEYSSRFHHDIKGLGHYDRAAIAFGYAELVEVWGDKAAAALKKKKGWFEVTRNEVRFALGTMTTDAKKKDVVYTDYESGDARLLLDSLYRGTLHYTHMPKMFGGTKNLADRRFVPYADLIAERSGSGSKGLADPKQRKLMEVPYRFCSDEYEMGTPTCAMYDEGADSWEMVHGALSKYHDYYFVHAFRRDRTNFYTWDYDGHVYWNNFMPVLNLYQHWFDTVTESAIFSPAGLWDTVVGYRAVDLGVVNEGEAIPYWEQHILGGLGATEGVKMGLNELAQVVAMPEPGGYCYDKKQNRYYRKLLSSETKLCAKSKSCHSDFDDPFDDPNWDGECVNLNVPLGVGRHEETVYDGETGYYYYERLRYIGAYYDKWNALAVLTDPETMFIGKDASQALASYVISTMVQFRPQMMRFFGALIAGRKDQFAWKVDASGKTPKIDKTNVFLDGDARKKHDALPFIEPPGLYNLRPTAMWMGMAWFNADWDQSFNHSSKVWVKGAADAVEPAKGATVVTFDNPLDHHSYQAVQMSNPEVYSIGIEMLKTCQAAAKTWKAAGADDKYYAQVELEWAVQFLELLRGYQTLYGVLIW